MIERLLLVTWAQRTTLVKFWDKASETRRVFLNSGEMNKSGENHSHRLCHFFSIYFFSLKWRAMIHFWAAFLSAHAVSEWHDSRISDPAPHDNCIYHYDGRGLADWGEYLKIHTKKIYIIYFPAIEITGCHASGSQKLWKILIH